MMLNQTARPSPHELGPKGQFKKSNSISVLLLPSRSVSSEGRMEALLETLENANAPSNKSLRRYQQEAS